MRSETVDSGLSVEAQGVELRLGVGSDVDPLFQYLFVPQESSVNYGASIAYQASFKRAYLRSEWDIPLFHMLGFTKYRFNMAMGRTNKTTSQRTGENLGTEQKTNKEGADSK